MLSSRISVVYVLALAMAVCCVPAMAQIPSLDITHMTLNGSAGQLGDQQVLRLTQDGQTGQAGSGWYNTQQSVGNGFTTVFQFQITHNPDLGAGPADGFAFVVQNANTFEGGPLSALGGTGGDIAYGTVPGEGTPFDNAIAIEFDTFQNGWDPDANHIAVQSCGTGNNTPDHTATCQSGQPAKLGIAPAGVNLADGNVHTVILQYDPGTLSIFIDNAGTPVLTVPLQLSSLLSLNEGGTAYVGFTGATGAFTESNDILSWTFTPGGTGTQTTITQTLTPGPGQNFTNYVFGSYSHKYGYSGAQAGDQVSVTAMPSNPAVVNPILASFYPTASCIPYDGTGGECVVFQVTCTQQTGSDCSNLNYTLYESYNTQQTIVNPCLLKTEVYNPPSPSTWINIETAFSQTRFDPTSSGNSKGFSYFVAAQNCGTSSIRGNNCNGVFSGTYRGNLTVSNGQSCTFTNGGVTGNVTETGGSFVLQNYSFVGGNLHETGGTLSVSNSLVGNNLRVDGGGSFSIGPNVAIFGNLQIQGLPAGPGTNQVCATFIWGNLMFQNSGTGIQIGSSSGCGGNIVAGNLLVQNNSAPSVIDSNAVGGSLNDQNNSGATQVFTNAINNNLQCNGNTSITGGGNRARHKLGQCASF